MSEINGLNGDYKTRDTILFGKQDVDYSLGGIQYFTTTPQVIKELIAKKFIDEMDYQNSSPTIKEFIRAVDGYEDHVRFSGYAVSPKRDDYRVSIDAIDIDIPYEDKDMVSFFVESFHGADEFNLENVGDVYHLRAWWD